jgi:hypothetical protein
MKQNFAEVSQQFQAINNTMGVLSDKAHAIEMRIMGLEKMCVRASSAEERLAISDKIKHLEDAHKVRLQYEEISMGITNILTAPIQSALPPPPCNPLNIMQNIMPPPPPPMPFYPIESKQRYTSHPCHYSLQKCEVL